jgi:hypothetical protein
LTEILTKKAAITVDTAADCSTLVESDHLYVIPPDTVALRRGRTAISMCAVRALVQMVA